MPARILDDLVICRTRAYYTAHPETFRPRRIPDMEDSEKYGEVFVRRYFIPKLEELSREVAIHTILRLEDCNYINKEYYLSYDGLNKEIACKPDMVAIVLLRSKIPRTLVFEVAETDAAIVLRRKYVIPRLLLYMLATYLYYGIPSVGIYVSLSPSSSPPAVLFLPKGGVGRGLTRYLNEIRDLACLDSIPPPSKRPACSHCVYASICKYAVRA